MLGLKFSDQGPSLSTHQKHFEYLLIEGYIRQNILPYTYFNHLPSDIANLVLSYHYHGPHFLSESRFCTINSIGNILKAKYTKFNYISDWIQEYLPKFLICTGSIICIFICELIILSCFYLGVLMILYNCNTFLRPANRTSFELNYYAIIDVMVSHINHYGIRYLLIVLSAWVSLQPFIHVLIIILLEHMYQDHAFSVISQQ